MRRVARQNPRGKKIFGTCHPRKNAVWYKCLVIIVVTIVLGEIE